MKHIATTVIAAAIILGSIPHVFSQMVDPGFAPDITGGASAIAFQPDGRILIGGYFSAVSGLVRSNLARFYPDGSVDLHFRPEVDGRVTSIVLQADGKLLVGGSFMSLNGQPQVGLGRLNPDGSLDREFVAAVTDPPDVSSSSGVNCLALQADGKILVGGGFSGINGQLCPNLARLNADGTVDDTFTAQTASGGSCIAVQPDGRVLVAGTGIIRLQPDGTLDSTFTAGMEYKEYSVTCLVLQPDGRIVIAGTDSSTGQKYVCRLDPDGSLDPQFFQSDVKDPYPLYHSHFIASLALQADGKILVGGNFDVLAGENRSKLGRLNSNGTLDSTLAPTVLWTNHPPAAAVFSLAVQSDGNLVVAGAFSELSGQACTGFGRLLADAPTQESLSVNPPGTAVSWTRSGSQPEVAQVTLELSTDGTNYVFLGGAAWTNGAWQLAGLSLPFGQDFFVRARGRTISGSYTASSGLVESVQHFILKPVISQIERHPAGGFTLTCFGPPNRPCVSFKNEALSREAEWTPIATNTPAGDGRFVIHDLPPSESTQRLYRLWLP